MRPSSLLSLSPLSMLVSLALLSPLAMLGAPAYAADGTDELLSDQMRVPPVVIFVVDMSSDMNNSCDGVSATSCWSDAVQAIGNLSRHFDFARFGVVGTAELAGTDTYTPIAKVGSSYADIAAALASVSPYSTSTRNIAETVESVDLDLLSLSTVDGDGESDWTSSPIAYSCAETHIIVLTRDKPVDDDQIEFGAAAASFSPDVMCDAAGSPVSPDEQCFYDSVVTDSYYQDWSTLTGLQRAVVHTIGMGFASGSLADQLYENAALQTGGAGTYSLVSSGGEILNGILSIFTEIQAGTYTRSSPVITVDGAYMIYDYYELTGSNPLAQGHVRAYSLVSDPSDPYYGQVDYSVGDPAYGGAVWDGGNLLVSRIVEHADHNEFDNDGIRHRDIYFWDDTVAASYMSAPAVADRRLSFDRDFVTSIGVNPVLDNFIDTTRSDWSGCVAGTTSPEQYDFDLDCDVDDDDLQALVDFGRGLPTAKFRYLDIEHGSWKLQDSPYAIPVVVSARDGMYSMDTSYQAFLATLEADTESAPEIVLVPANDGMLHAFRLEDDPATVNDEKGQELWGWIPGYLLQREHDTEWANHLADQMLYGRTFMFDASPVVEDVWIDEPGAGYGTKAADGSEWHRIVVVSQGLGGPVTMALDITSTRYPQFLWEQTNTTDHTAMGYTTSRPVVFDVYDGARSHDQWVAMWGGGRAAGYTGSSGNAYYQSAEANLYMWNTGDTPHSDTESVGYSSAGDNIDTEHPDIPPETASTLNYDSDSNLENSYISAALAVVDVDGDGDGDVMYFPVTTSYTPTDGTNEDGSAGTGPGDPTIPGSSWMYKAIINTSTPDDLTWCKWYDPKIGTDGSNGVGARPEVYYAATTSWLAGGELGVYWGSGTPFDREGTSLGYFFAMYDSEPLSCASTAQPITCNGADGYLTLDSGEGLTSDPIVYAGVVYFTTYTPDVDRCVNGTGRVYGIRFDDCSPGMDTNGDSVADGSDDVSVESDGYTSGVTVGNGTVYYGTASPDPDGGDAVVETITATNAMFMNTATVAWMEMF